MDNLTKGEILAADDLVVEAVDVREWGGTCFIVTMSGDDRDAFDQWGDENTRGEDRDWRGLRANLVGRTLADASGEPLGFTAAEIMALGKKSCLALDRCFDVAQRLNGIGDADIEALAKNSPDGQNGDSG